VTTPASRLALFADTLYAGVLLTVAALPVLTAYVAVVAAAGLLRERAREDAPVTVPRFATRMGAVIRHHPGVLVVPPLVGTVLALNGVALAAGVPGGRPLAVVVAAVAAAVVVLALRAAVAWEPTRTWRATLTAAGGAALADVGGSALLLGAVAAAVVISWTWLALTPLTAGLVVFATVAVSERGASARR
jgi:hypothetical protein